MARKRKLSAKARRAALRNLAKARRARKGGTKRRRRKAVVRHTTHRRKSVARRRSTKAVAKRRRRTISFTRLGHRIYRRNPGGGIKGVIGIVKEGFVGAVGVKLGRAGSNAILQAVSKKLPQAAVGVTGLGAAAATGVVVGWAARRFLPKYATPLTYGAFLPLVEGLIAQYAPLSVQSFLAGDIDGALSAYPQMAAYPRLSAYPTLSGMSDINAGGDGMLIGDVQADYGFAGTGM